MVGSGTYGCIRYDVLDDDEMGPFLRKKEIKRLIREDKVGIEGNEVWIIRGDAETREALDIVLYGYDVNY